MKTNVVSFSKKLNVWVNFILGIGLITQLSNCANITTMALHTPIYPANGEDVTYNITSTSSKGIKQIQLFERMNSINAMGVVTAGTETSIQNWTTSGSPTAHTVSFIKTGGYGTNQLIDYRIVTTTSNNKTRTYTVTYAIRPYPVVNEPAPVYAQGNEDDVFDVIFIPDTDITNIAAFRSNCEGMITNSIHREPTMKFFSRQFNFYINTQTGTATDFDRTGTDGVHQMPSNNANLSFAEVRVLMHANTLRDYAMGGGIFSTEMDRPQTFIHEGGHAMFGLKDEYCNAPCNQQAEIPNVWTSRATAEAAAPRFGKTDTNVVPLCTGGTACFKMCGSNCPMISGSALLFDYDRPCEDRTIYEILLNAIN